MFGQAQVLKSTLFGALHCKYSRALTFENVLQGSGGGGQQPQTATPQGVTPQSDTGLGDGCLEGEVRGKGLLRCWKLLGELWGSQYRRQVYLLKSTL